jgi:hypothetical protein
MPERPTSYKRACRACSQFIARIFWRLAISLSMPSSASNLLLKISAFDSFLSLTPSKMVLSNTEVLIFKDNKPIERDDINITTPIMSGILILNFIDFLALRMFCQILSFRVI